MQQIVLDQKIRAYKKANIQTKFDILFLDYWTSEHISVLMECGIPAAREYRKKIINEIQKSGKDLPLNGLIPAKFAIDFLEIDTKSIREKYRLFISVSK
jgi:hypothetical protein